MFSNKMNKQEFSKYERARIVGARGLQISMDAPLLVDIGDAELDNLNYDPLKIAEKELDSGVLPISVNKPMPRRKEEGLEKVKIEENIPSDAQKIAAEKEITREIAEGGDMMKLTDSDDDSEADEEIVDENELE